MPVLIALFTSVAVTAAFVLISYLLIPKQKDYDEK
jgi:hypothetical protein